eukprot:scaffold169769_cov47-Prasinocladus_malaysianus.AAC.1
MNSKCAHTYYRFGVLTVAEWPARVCSISPVARLHTLAVVSSPAVTATAGGPSPSPSEQQQQALTPP